MDTRAAGADVLVVDDDEATRQTLSEMLVAAGYSAATAAGGLQALAYLSEHQQSGTLPQLIILDLVMPFNGWAFRKQQQRDPALAQIPVVILSGVYQPEP